VTELTQPLSDVSPVRQVQAQFRGTAEAHPPTFTELVYAHYDWWKTRREGRVDPAAEAAWDSALAAFEARHGRLVRAYWCAEVESAVALTEKKGRLRGLLSPAYGFHRESDWATKNAPEVAAELHRCDALAVRGRAVLTGVRQHICLELVVSCAANLLSLVDVRARSGDETKTAEALEHEHAAVSKVEGYYHNAANGQAQLVYFAGIATVTIALGGLAAVWLSVSWASPVAALVAGALGAVVSVIQRINSGKFELEYDVGGPYTFFLGGLRPLIGGVFAMAITFAFSGGLLQLPVAARESTDHRHLALLVLAFLAGFSERWAQDALTAIVPVTQNDLARNQAAPGSGPPAGGQQQQPGANASGEGSGS
jgi:hypothetical protein